MELIERVNVSVAKWLEKQSKTSLHEILKRKSHDSSTIDEKYNRLMNYLKAVIKTNGIITRIYSFSEKINTLPESELGGRLFCGLSMQGIPKEFRGILMNNTTDIDMCNAHPTILKYICSLHNILCPNLEYYISHRSEILNQFTDQSKAKTLFLCSINDSKSSKSEKNKFFKEFDKEMKNIQNELSKIDIYNNITHTLTSVNNTNGKLINRIMCIHENKILQKAISFLNSNNIEIGVLMFDGLMIYGNHYDNSQLLQDLSDYCNSIFNGLNLQWQYKPHSTDIVPPTDLDYSTPIPLSEKEIKKQEHDATIEKIQLDLDKRTHEFEKSHCKIINKGLYLHEYIDEYGHKVYQLLTQKQLTIQYEHLDIAFERYALTKGAINPCSFIKYWITANPTIRSYDDMDIYPNPSECPPNIFNLWTPFYADTLLQNPSIPINNEYIDFFRNHLYILSGKDKRIQTYFEMWIAHMFQFPEQKSNCPIFISKEGSGKGTFTKTIEAILGGKKCFETTNPVRDVFGPFNGQMADSFFVNINEIGKKDLAEYMGLLKGLITDKPLTINKKGIESYKIKSFHRFVFTTNNTDPIDINQDNRRFWIVRCSDEFKGNAEYFNKFNQLIEDPCFIKSIYSYFKLMPNIDNFIELDLPISEFHKNIQDSNVSDVERWLKSYVLYYAAEVEKIVLIKNLYNEFVQWCEINKCKYVLTSKKFSLEIANLQFNGVYKGSHTKHGDTKRINIDELKLHFGIGCLVECNDTDGEDDTEC
jgi:hypothetical protein